MAPLLLMDRTTAGALHGECAVSRSARQQNVGLRVPPKTRALRAGTRPKARWRSNSVLVGWHPGGGCAVLVRLSIPVASGGAFRAAGIAAVRARALRAIAPLPPPLPLR